MSMLSERWQHVESQLATKDRVHTFYAGATALWDMKLDQFQRQLDTLLDGCGRSVVTRAKVATRCGRATRARR